MQARLKRLSLPLRDIDSSPAKCTHKNLAASGSIQLSPDHISIEETPGGLTYMDQGNSSPGGGVRSGKRKLLVRMWGEIEEVIEGDVDAGMSIRESNHKSNSYDDVEQSTKDLVALVKGAGGTAVGAVAGAARWNAKDVPFRIGGEHIDDMPEGVERSLMDVQLSHLSGDGRGGSRMSENIADNRKVGSASSHQQYDEEDSSEGEEYGWNVDGKAHDVRWESVLHASIGEHAHPRAALDQNELYDKHKVQSYYARDNDYEHVQAGVLLKHDDGSESEGEEQGVGLVSRRTGQRHWLRKNPNSAMC
jgi:hypothetical protein